MTQGEEQTHSIERVADALGISPVAYLRWRIAEDFPVVCGGGNLAQFGYTSDDFVSGRVSWVEITHPDDRPRLEREVADCLARGIDGFSNRYRIRDAAGAYVWVQDWNHVVRNQDGQPDLINGVIVAVRRFLEGDEVGQLTLESPLYGVMILQDGKVAFASETACVHAGIGATQLVGAPVEKLFDLVDAEHRERVVMHFSDRIAGKHAPARYQVSLSAGGKRRWIELNVRLATYHGRPAVHALTIDVTARHEAEQSLLKMRRELEAQVREHSAALEARGAHLREESARREEAESANRDTRNYLQTIIETSHDGILVVDAEGRFEFANESCLRIFGYSAEAFLGTHFIHMVPEDMHPFIMQRWQEVQEGRGAPYEVDILAGGSERRSLLVSHRHMDIGGVRKYCVVVKDITERKRAEQELERQQEQLESLVQERTAQLRETNKQLSAALAARDKVAAALEENEKSFRAIASNAQEAIIIADEHNTILYVNSFTTEMTGLVQEDLLGASALDILDPGDRERVAGFTRMRFAGEAVPRPYEATVVAKDGRRIVVEITGAATEWRGRSASIGMLRDITERKHAERELLRRELILDLGQEIANSGSWTVELPDMSSRFSKQMMRICGYAPSGEQPDYSDRDMLIHPHDRQLVNGELQRVINERGEGRIESRLVRLDGDIRDLLTQMRFVAGEGDEPDRIIGTSTDITELRRLERDVLDAAQHEQQRVGRDLHDTLGQELAGIAFHAKALERRLRDAEPQAAEEAKRLAELARQSVEGCRRIAHGLAPVTIEAESLLPEIEKLCSGTQELYGIPCDCRLNDAVEIDDSRIASHLYQIAREALVNAMRHASASQITLSLSAEPGLCVLRVTDNGSWRDGDGAERGIGLRVMRHRSEIIGGALSVDHGDGVPTCVTCRFPLPQPDPASPERA